jgi:hypothetical protein
LRDIDRATRSGFIFSASQLDLRVAAKHYQDLVFLQVPMHPNHITRGQVRAAKHHAPRAVVYRIYFDQ